MEEVHVTVESDTVGAGYDVDFPGHNLTLMNSGGGEGIAEFFNEELVSFFYKINALIIIIV